MYLNFHDVASSTSGAAASALIPPLIESVRPEHGNLLHMLADPSRWCPPSQEPALIDGLLLALARVPGFPAWCGLSVLPRDDRNSPPRHIHGGHLMAGIVLAVDSRAPSHEFIAWRRYGSFHHLPTPPCLSPNGMFEALALVLGQDLDYILRPATRNETDARHLRLLTVRELGRDVQTCGRLQDIELPELDGLLALMRRPAGAPRPIMNRHLLLRIQQALPVFQEHFGSRVAIERALGLARGSLLRHFDSNWHPIGYEPRQ